MKLIYIANVRIPTEKAHGYQIAKMCEQFAAAGAVVELITPTKNNPIKQDLFEYYGLKKNFGVCRLKMPDFLVYEKILGRLAMYLQWLFFTVKLFFLKVKPGSLIYTRDQGAALVFGIRGLSVCFEAHDWSSAGTSFAPFLLKKVKYSVATTDFTKEELIGCGFKPAKILVASNGVELADFIVSATAAEFRKQLKLPLDKKIILYSGQLYAWKGVDIFLKAAARLAEQTDILFIVVGGASQEVKKYREVAANRKLENIVFTGNLPRKIVPSYLIAADLLILPNSAKNRESIFFTSPIKMFEYLAAGKPIIASDLPSLRLILNNGNCIFFEPDNFADLAEKIKQALADPVLREKISRQARADAEQYGWDKRARKILEFIKG